MKRTSLAVVALFGATVFTFSTSPTVASSPTVIYGEDNRVDAYAEVRSDLRELADSTAALIPNEALTRSGFTKMKITSESFGKAYDLCKEEPFFDQPTAAICSAALIGPDLVITAGHCISDRDCADNSFVFNYRMQSAKNAPDTVPRNEVYKCKKVVAREQTPQQDYAIVQLERPVKGHNILKMAKTAAAPKDEVLVIGHPTGLPTKITGKAVVRTSEEAFFVTNLDTYGGNSGSAVFNNTTHEIVGILVRGETDFSYDRSTQCNRSNFCDENGCRGEDVTHISYVLKALGL